MKTSETMVRLAVVYPSSMVEDDATNEYSVNSLNQYMMVGRTACGTLL